MNGTIIAINRINGMHAVQIEDGGVTVFELTDSHDAALGDVIAGELQTLGSETLANKTQQESFDAYIQDAFCSDSRWRALLSL